MIYNSYMVWFLVRSGLKIIYYIDYVKIDVVVRVCVSGFLCIFVIYKY